VRRSKWTCKNIFAVYEDRVGKGDYFTILNVLLDIPKPILIKGALIASAIFQPPRYIARIQKCPDITNKAESRYVVQVELDGVNFERSPGYWNPKKA